MATFGTFTSGQVLTAAELNTAGVWQGYTPTWTQSVAITKTVDFARYTQLNKFVRGSIKMTATSAGTANNKILVGLPVNAAANNFIMGTLFLFDASPATAKYRWGLSSALYESATTMSFTPRDQNGAAALLSDADDRFGQNYAVSGSNTNGFTIASGDIIWIQFAYEAA
jgi:hypothetical protein